MPFFAHRLLVAILDLYTLAVIVRLLFSWAPPQARANKFYEFLFLITEPALKPFRKLIPPVSGFDFSPIVLLVLLSFVRRVLWW